MGFLFIELRGDCVWGGSHRALPLTIRDSSNQALLRYQCRCCFTPLHIHTQMSWLTDSNSKRRVFVFLIGSREYAQTGFLLKEGGDWNSPVQPQRDTHIHTLINVQRDLKRSAQTVPLCVCVMSKLGRCQGSGSKIMWLADEMTSRAELLTKLSDAQKPSTDVTFPHKQPLMPPTAERDKPAKL